MHARARKYRNGGMNVTERDKRFAEEYIIDLNAYAAAIRAGYAPATAKNAAAWIREEAPEKPMLRRHVERLMAARSRRTGITADRVLHELAKIGFANAADVVDFETGKVRTDAKRSDLATVQGVRVRRGDTTEYEVKLADKTRALEMLGKHMNLFKDNLRIDGALPVIVDDG